MGPAELQSSILALAEYIEGSPSPEIGKVALSIRGLLSATDRISGDLKHFMKPEIDGFQRGMDALVKRLRKVVDTLNPQDEAYAYLAPTLAEWERIRDDLTVQLEDFENVSI